MDLDKKQKKSVVVSLVFIALGIALGAIGAHALEGVSGIEPKHVESWKTGVLYQLFQGLGVVVLLCLGLLVRLKKFQIALNTILIGTGLFSMSIYALVLNHIWDFSWLKILMIPLTPLGGLLMIVGWVIFIVKMIKHKP